MAIIIKTEKQIDGIRKSCKLAHDTLCMLDKEVNEGISTNRINELVDTYIRDHGAIPAPLNYNGYPKSVCTSINEVICHGIPDETILKNGDIINIDVTTILDGYYGDTSKMFVIGEVSQETKNLLNVTKECLDISIKLVKPNNQFGLIGMYITRHARKHGYSVVSQFCGHGTGLEFHEEPQINHHYDPVSYENRVMKPGMVFTIEPMINQKRPNAKILSDGWTAITVDGALSAQYEHTILVTVDGAEILT